MELMPKTLRLGLVALVLLGLMGVMGCGAKTNRISIAGSTSVQPIAETLAEAYMKKHRQAVVNVQGGGSSAGIKAVKDGTVALGTSSRPLKPEEESGLIAVEIAWDGIAIITNAANQVANLSLEQLRDIFSGKITNWSSVRGGTAPIVVVNREEGSGTRSAFVDVVMQKTPLMKTLVQNSTGAVRQSVAGNPNAIGYISLAGLDRTVKPLSINDTVCNVTNIKSKKYQVIRPFLFIFKKPGTLEVKALIDYVMNEGQQIIKANGLVPIK
jgi:phosphate transport system substrate-binding protein